MGWVHWVCVCVCVCITDVVGWGVLGDGGDPE